MPRCVALLLLGALLSAGACLPPPPGDGGLDAGAEASTGDGGALRNGTVTLGTGQLGWEDVSLADGRLELIYGAQGGYHVWGRMRLRSATPPDVMLSWQVVRLSDGAMVHTTREVRRWVMDGTTYGIHPAGAGLWETDAELVILGIRCSSEVLGQRVRVSVFVRENSPGGAVYAEDRDATIMDEVNPVACVGR